MFSVTKLFSFIVVSLYIFSSFAYAKNIGTIESNGKKVLYGKGEIIVLVKAGYSKDILSSITSKIGATVIKRNTVQLRILMHLI